MDPRIMAFFVYIWNCERGEQDTQSPIKPAGEVSLITSEASDVHERRESRRLVNVGRIPTVSHKKIKIALFFHISYFTSL